MVVDNNIHFMNARDERQEAIRDIIRSKKIKTQRMLVDELQERGFACTQSTVSRDVSEMKLKKQVEGSYVLNEDLHLTRMVSDLVMSVMHTNNFTIVKTSGGAASGVAAALDDALIPELLGTIAGDDTILLICEDEDAAIGIREKLKGMMSRQ